MKLVAALCAALLAASCAAAGHQAPSAEAPPPSAAAEAPAPARAEVLPVRGDGPPPLREDEPLTRIAVGSGLVQDSPLPVLAAVAWTLPDLYLQAGDGVRPGAVPTDPSLPELKEAYGELSMNAHFSAFNMAFPILATWSGLDYGDPAAAGDFPGKGRAERLFETFWRDAALGGERPGVYGARIFGPSGRRVQVLMLDTRSFRYRADDLLGEEQWAWVAAELRKPAEIRLLVSTAPGASDGWSLPGERERLTRAIGETGARGVLLVSSGARARALKGRLAALLTRSTRSPLQHSLAQTPPPDLALSRSTGSGGPSSSLFAGRTGRSSTAWS
jgi:alkaline phosphatase D